MSTGIQWTDETWNPHPERLEQPLHWRKPRRIFVNSMSDLFHEAVPDAFIDQVFAAMALAPQHVFQVLTKRPARMVAWFDARVDNREHAVGAAMRAMRPGDAGLPEWPLPNVWLGVSVENQRLAEERIPWLLDTPAAVRFVSYEPALGPVDFTRLEVVSPEGLRPGVWLNAFTGHLVGPDDILPARLDWVIVGGESGPEARPFELEWAYSVVDQCRAAGVSCFVKQLGRRPVVTEGSVIAKWTQAHTGRVDDSGHVLLHDKKGGDMSEWPEDLRVREWPVILSRDSTRCVQE